MTDKMEYGALIRTTGKHPWWLDGEELVWRPLPCGPSERKARHVTTWNHDFRVRADHPFYESPVTHLVDVERTGETPTDTVLRLISGMPLHDDDRGPGNMTLVDALPNYPGQTTAEDRLRRIAADIVDRIAISDEDRSAEIVAALEQARIIIARNIGDYSGILGKIEGVLQPARAA